MQIIELGTISAEVEFKDIKNVHLSVYPPNGRVRIAAPLRMELETIRMFTISKLSWIKAQQAQFMQQERETKRDYINHESHYFFGKRYLMKIVYIEAKPTVYIKHNKLIIQVRPGTTAEQRELLLQEWYRGELKERTAKLIQKWEQVLNLKVAQFGIKKMKTKWGTCKTEDRRIWLNLELAKKPIQCLEYIVVHEMLHLLERTHNDRFVKLLTDALPNWRQLRDELNNLPVSHTEWKY